MLLKQCYKCIYSAAILALMLAISFPSKAKALQSPTDRAPETIEELRTAILEILHETGVPAAGIALVNRDGPVWVAGLGLADREKEIPADTQTMFRIGSTSKIFVALAILKLQASGELSLRE